MRVMEITTKHRCQLTILESNSLYHHKTHSTKDSGDHLQAVMFPSTSRSNPKCSPHKVVCQWPLSIHQCNLIKFLLWHHNNNSRLILRPLKQQILSQWVNQSCLDSHQYTTLTWECHRYLTPKSEETRQSSTKPQWPTITMWMTLRRD